MELVLETKLVKMVTVFLISVLLVLLAYIAFGICPVQTALIVKVENVMQTAGDLLAKLKDVCQLLDDQIRLKLLFHKFICTIFYSHYFLLNQINNIQAIYIMTIQVFQTDDKIITNYQNLSQLALNPILFYFRFILFYFTEVAILN